jgi:hypothetical protein
MLILFLYRCWSFSIINKVFCKWWSFFFIDADPFQLLTKYFVKAESFSLLMLVQNQSIPVWDRMHHTTLVQNQTIPASDRTECIIQRWSKIKPFQPRTEPNASYNVGPKSNHSSLGPNRMHHTTLVRNQTIPAWDRTECIIQRWSKVKPFQPGTEIFFFFFFINHSVSSDS